ncbi:hypothetical protein BMB171_C1931 [Bacillus thuringiensis BMB171]|nr:hypothetical protein BMB171_C1931 [Bacillus thuringiensis BMB171]
MCVIYFTFKFCLFNSLFSFFRITRPYFPTRFHFSFFRFSDFSSSAIFTLLKSESILVNPCGVWFNL